MQITLADGSVYEGTLKDGKPHGQGKITSFNGCVYDGNWEDGKQHPIRVWRPISEGHPRNYHPIGAQFIRDGAEIIGFFTGDGGIRSTQNASLEQIAEDYSLSVGGSEIFSFEEKCLLNITVESCF